MVSLARSELEELERLAIGATRGVRPAIDSVEISAHGLADDIEDLTVFITLHVTEDEGWSLETGTAVRRQVSDSLNAALRERHPTLSYAITTFLRPQPAQAA